jgi:N4-gp56 family major capsid protein
MANIQTTNSKFLSASMQTYYDKRLVQNMKPRLVHQSYGQKRQIPRNGGKAVNFRKFSPFPAATNPLGEGVTPEGQNLEITSIPAELDQYGEYVMGSDLLDLTAVDPVLDETTELLGDQAGLSVDHIVRDVICKGTNVQYANGKATRDQLLITDKMTTTEIRKAVRTLKNNKAKPFIRNGKPYYYAIIDHDTAYDLMDDDRWQNVADYQQGEKVENGEIGKLFGCIFVESTEAKKFAAAGLSEANRNLTVASYDAMTVPTITLAEALSEADAASLAERHIILKDMSVNPVVWETVTIASASSGVAGNATIVLDDAPSFTPAANDMIYPGEAGADGMSVNCTLVFGKDAYGVVDIEGEGTVKNIIKPKGSAGTTDPLDQRWTSGWKVEGFATVILQPAWLVRVEHGFSQ